MQDQQSPPVSSARSGWGAGILLVVPFAVLASLPWWITPGPYSLVTSGTLAALVGALVWSARPRRSTPSHAEHVDSQPGVVRLTHSSDRHRRGDQLYAAERVSEARRTLLVESDNPALVLEQALRHAQRAGTTLLPGWGLDHYDIEALGSVSTRRTGRSLPSLRLSTRRWPGARGATVTLIVVSCVVLAVVSFGVAFEHGAPSSTSLSLAMLAVLLPLLLTPLTASQLEVVVADDRVVFYQTLLGWRRIEASFAADEVLHVCATSPSGRFHKHLLVRTVFGLRCIRCAGALSIVRAVHASWKDTPGRAVE